MSSTEADASSRSGGMTDLFSRLRNMPRLGLIIGVAAAVTVLAGLFLWTRSPDYAVLYSGLDASGGGSVTAKLDQMNIPYRLSGGGSVIEVPRSDVDRLRLTLAGDGLPKRAGVGFDSMQKEPFGTSAFNEQMDYQQALAGELAQSIETLDGVEAARVQLALPTHSVFVSEQKPPKASVVLKLYAGRSLSHSQVYAIQNLVASAVTGLPVDAVTVVDQQGNLLSQTAGQNNTDNQAGQLGIENTVEQRYENKINTLLGAIVGPQNVRTQVVADINFAQRNSTSENFSPNNGQRPQAIRSMQTNRSVQAGNQNGGVPGALSNQPTPDATSPINNPQSKPTSTDGGNGQTANGNGDGTGNDGLQSSGSLGLINSSNSTTNDQTINYELDHVISHVVEPSGQVARISVAVVINKAALAQSTLGGSAGAGGKGTYSQEQAVQALAQLVRGAIGFSKQRGDQVEILPVAFDASANEQNIQQPAWWQNPDLQALVIKALKYLVLIVIAWLLWRRLVRPLAERAGVLNGNSQPSEALPAAPANVSATAPPEDSSQSAEAALRSRRRADRDLLAREVREIARNDPERAAMVVKNWIKEDG